MPLRRLHRSALIVLVLTLPGSAGAAEEEFVQAHIQPFKTPQPLPVPRLETPQPLPAPGIDTTGLTWDGERLWGADSGSGTIQRFDQTHRGWEIVDGHRGRPGPLAWDAAEQLLWAVDEAARTIHAYRTTGVELEHVREIGIPEAALREVPSITGIAHDGRDLWIAIGCGLCSTLFRVETQNGELLESFFPQCVPRGLAFAPAGRTRSAALFTIAYSGLENPAYLSRRRFSGSPPTIELDQSLLVFEPIAPARPGVPRPADIWPGNPAAFTIADDRVLVVERNPKTNETTQITKYLLPANQ